MTGNPILSRFQAFGGRFRALFQPNLLPWPNLHTLWLHPDTKPSLSVRVCSGVKLPRCSSLLRNALPSAAIAPSPPAQPGLRQLIGQLVLRLDVPG